MTPSDNANLRAAHAQLTQATRQLSHLMTTVCVVLQRLDDAMRDDAARAGAPLGDGENRDDGKADARASLPGDPGDEDRGVYRGTAVGAYAPVRLVATGTTEDRP